MSVGGGSNPAVVGAIAPVAAVIADPALGDVALNGSGLHDDRSRRNEQPAAKAGAALAAISTLSAGPAVPTSGLTLRVAGPLTALTAVPTGGLVVAQRATDEAQASGRHINAAAQSGLAVTAGHATRARAAVVPVHLIAGDVDMTERDSAAAGAGAAVDHQAAARSRGITSRDGEVAQHDVRLVDLEDATGPARRDDH